MEFPYTNRVALATLSALPTLAAIASLTGCAVGPQAKLMNTRAEPVYDDGRLKEVSFLSEVQTQSMGQEQLRYEVRLHDRKGRAVKSGDSQFRLKNGQVAATKTFMANELNETFGVRVTIPAEQLELRNDMLPAYAEAELYYQNDQSLDRQTCPIPIARMDSDVAGAPKPEKPKTAKKPVPTKKEAAPKKPVETKRAPADSKPAPSKPAEKSVPKPKPKPKEKLQPKPSNKPDNP